MRSEKSFAPEKLLAVTPGVAECKKIRRDKKEELTVSEENKDKTCRQVEEAFGQGKLEVVDHRQAFRSLLQKVTIKQQQRSLMLTMRLAPDVC